MHLHNIMTCEGFDKGILGGCNLSWVTFAITLALAAILRRQCQDGILAGTNYNSIGGFGVGLGMNLLFITLFGDPRWAFLAGIAGVAIGGFLLGMILPTEEVAP